MEVIHKDSWSKTIQMSVRGNCKILEAICQWSDKDDPKKNTNMSRKSVYERLLAYQMAISSTVLELVIPKDDGTVHHLEA